MFHKTFNWILSYLLLSVMFVTSYHYEWEITIPECAANETFSKCENGCFEPSCFEIFHVINKPVCRARRPACVCLQPFHRDDFTHRCVLAQDCSRYESTVVLKSEELKREEKRKRKSRSEIDDDKHAVIRVQAHQSILSMILPEELFHMKKLLQSLPVKVIVRRPQEYKKSKPYIAVIIPKLNIISNKKKPKPTHFYMDLVPQKYFRGISDFPADNDEYTTIPPKFYDALQSNYPSD